MRRSAEIIFNLLFWGIITYVFYYLASTNAHIAANSVNNYGMFHIPQLAFVIFFSVLPPVINYYIFYLILIPKLFLRKKYLLFLLFAFVSSAVTGFGYNMTFGGFGSFVSKYIFFTLMALFWGIIGSAVKGIFLWIESQQERRTLEKRNLMNRNALLLLQAQINPHFLFNSLNNIDVLIEENPRTASEYLKKLSDILRYVVYETKDELTLLSNEINQIQSYIDLQRIRTKNLNYVNFSVTGEVRDQMIAPMLFIPFIENAFKHSKNKNIENAINIEFEIATSGIKMICQNYFETPHVNIIKNEGSGIETIKQRLNLLYPGKHRLTIETTDHIFRVTLEISLKDGN